MTIAVLPGPLSHIQPANNMDLADRIVQNGGLLITKYLNESEHKYEALKRYTERDRLQALYSDCCAIAASYAANNQGNDSGARHALQKAKAYGLLRAVMYDSYFEQNPQYDLNRQILSDKDATGLMINPNTLTQDIKLLMQKIQQQTIPNQIGLF